MYRNSIRFAKYAVLQRKCTVLLLRILCKLEVLFRVVVNLFANLKNALEVS